MAPQTLLTEKIMGVLVTACRVYRPEQGNKHYIWDYEPWSSLHEKIYENLFSPCHKELYPGQYAHIRYREICLQPENHKIARIVGAPERKRFMLQNNQIVTLLNPRSGRRRNSTYATWISAELNGKEIKLNISAVANGKVIEHGEPQVIINAISPSSSKGYILHAEFLP